MEIFLKTIKRETNYVSQEILRIMKISFLLMVATILQVSASVYSQKTKLNFSLENTTVKEVLEEVERQSEFTFFYNDAKLDVTKKISLDVRDKNIKDVLDKVLNKGEVVYEIVDKHIILRKAKSQTGKKKVTGIVTDKKGNTLPGVSVMEKGTDNGVVTDVNGKYTINISENSTTLIFSFVGMGAQEIDIVSRRNIDVVLSEDLSELDEVVVTALGLSREKKALGYSVQKVEGESVSESKEIDAVNSLAGKVSGVHITQGGGGLAGGGSRIVIRGETSLAGNNTPMFVVDGMPVSSLNDISSYDIEDISVLKGPAAAALYGSRAGAGVILITTKEGPKNGKLNVEFSSSFGIQNPMVLPEVQDQYGQGVGGTYQANKSDSWGPKFDGQSIDQLWGGKEWKSNPNNAKDFYETGTVVSNNVSLSGDNKTGMFRVSFTDIRQKGLIPNTEYKENRIDVTSGWKFLDDKLNIKANVKYARRYSDNDKGMDPRMWPTNLNLNELKDYWVEKGIKQKQWLEQSDNPYFSLHENKKFWRNEKFIGNLTLNYNITKNLSIMLRTGANRYLNEDRYQEQATTEGTNNEYGMFNTGMSNGFEINSDFLISYKKSFKDFSVNASFGGNMMSKDGSWIRGESSQLLIPNVYNLGNYRTYPTVSNAYDLHRKTNALYGFVNVGYKDMIYLDVTGRNDWSSTLAYKENDSYFYPSASLSVLLNKMVDMGKHVNLLKLKANYAGVGNDTEPFQLNPFYSFGRGNGGVAGLQEDQIKNTKDLKPEFTHSYEFGIQSVMFNNRLNLDLTYYHTNTKNQIWSMDVSSISGYNKIIRNIGEVQSKGLELTLSATPIKYGKFEWRTSVNWSMDVTEVTELDDENPEYAITRSIGYNLYTYDYVGKRRGAIYSRVARKFKYDPAVHDASLAKYNGQLFFDGSKDLPRSDKEIVGYYNPDWIGSWSNEFRYGNISLSALLFANVGNSVYNGFEKAYVSKGLDKRTVEGREKGVLPAGVWESPDGIRPFKPGEEVNAESYWGDFMTDGEIYDLWVEDGSFVKLKEVQLGYELPKKLLSKTPFQFVKLSVTGRNLALWTKVKHVDPETFSSSGSAGLVPGIANAGGVPSVRSFTFNLMLRF